MADDKMKNLGHQKGMDEGRRGGQGHQQAPGPNPQGDQSASQKKGGHERKGTQFESDVERNRQDPGYKRGQDEAFLCLDLYLAANGRR